jgi:olefin beta-lactone synthetase
VITTASGAVTPVGIEQRVERIDGVSAAAVVGVGPAGAQVVVTIVAAAGRRPGRSGPGLRPGGRGARFRLAGTDLADAVRAAAGVDVAAVLLARELPVDVRHQSKVDRGEVARRAARVLAGARAPHRP